MFISYVKGQAYLPEYQAYRTYCNQAKIECEIVDNVSKVSKRADTIWLSCGIFPLNIKEKFLVHEYQSGSTGSFCRLKNQIKSILNQAPTCRVFLNTSVKNQFPLLNRSKVPYFFRDMGVSNNFFEVYSSSKPYEFVYIGSTDQIRGFDELLESVKRTNKKTLIVGRKPLYLKNYNFTNIEFSGVLPYEEVAKTAILAKFGLNYIPNREPFNSQTSTKLLEYLALGLKIITSHHKPSTDFLDARHAKYLFFSKDLSIPTEYESAEYFTPSVHDREWIKVIERSGIFQFLSTQAKSQS